MHPTEACLCHCDTCPSPDLPGRTATCVQDLSFSHSGSKCTLPSEAALSPLPSPPLPSSSFPFQADALIEKPLIVNHMRISDNAGSDYVLNTEPMIPDLHANYSSLLPFAVMGSRGDSHITTLWRRLSQLCGSEEVCMSMHVSAGPVFLSYCSFRLAFDIVVPGASREKDMTAPLPRQGCSCCCE